MPRQSGRERIVVVGDGMVGHRFCEQIAASPERDRYELMVFAEEPRPAYDRVNLGEVLRGRDADTLGLASARWYADHGFALHLGDPVLEMDLPGRRIRARSGAVAPFDRLVLATGSAAVVPPLAADESHAEGLLPLRTLEDVQRLRDRLPAIGKVMVLGGGLLGIETAVTLSALTLEVEIVEAGRHLLGGRLDAEAAGVLQRQLERRRLRVRLGTTAAAISHDEGGYRVELSTGERVRTDLVVVAAGVRPRDELARRAGLAVGPRGGVVVDDLLRSSHPHVYAIGECAAAEGVRPGHVGPGYRMADALARTVLGDPAPFEPPTEPVHLKTPELEVFLVGEQDQRPESRRSRRALIRRAPDRYRKVVLAGGRVVGAQAVGPWKEAARVTRAVMQNLRVGALARHRFLRRGELWPDGPPVSQPDQEIVCVCGNVTFGALCHAVDRGCSSLAALREQTGAGRGCGGCLPQLIDLFDPDRTAVRARGARAQGSRRALGIIGLLALVGTVVGLAGPALPSPRGLLGPWTLSAVWTEMRLQEWTGYGLLAVFGMALLFPLMKLAGIRRGARVVHAAVGLAAVVAGIVHSGGRLGANFNLVLAVATAALLGLGAVSTVLAAGVLRPPVAPRWITAVRLAHVALLWPALTLVGIHMYAVLAF